MLPEDGWRLRDARAPLTAWDHRLTGEAWARGPKSPSTPMGAGIVLWWRRGAVGGSIVTNGTDELFCGHPYTSRFSFCFDLNGRLNWGWRKPDGTGSVWHYYDDLLGGYSELELPLVLDLCCATDHYRTEGVDSGVVIAYTRGNALLVRNQVDRYQSEHLHLILEKQVPLRTCGLTPEWRFAFRFEDKIAEGTEWDDPLDNGGGGEPGDWEGGLGGSGQPGWYRYGESNAAFQPIVFPWDTGFDVSVSGPGAPETTVQGYKDNVQLYIDALGLEGARAQLEVAVANQFTGNIVRPGTVLEWPYQPFGGQGDTGAASTWLLRGPGTGANWMLVYGVDQVQVYLDPADPQEDWQPPSIVMDGTAAMALAFQECDGPSCPTEYTLNWPLELIVEVNYQAILDWIFEGY